jgi:eukaryotic-like serine/threonine-protein kinase
MGAVYRAHDTKLGRDVAIKVLPPALANDADYIARFQREAQVLASLNHPNIAAIYGLEDNAIVMELVEGEELKGPLPLDEAVRIAKQIADALEAAHERGIIHRDLKPANIKITADGTRQGSRLRLGKGHRTGEDGIRERGEFSDPHPPRHTSRHDPRHRGLHGPRAGSGQTGRSPGRHLGVLWELITGRQLFQGETVSHTCSEGSRRSAIPQSSARTLIGRCLDRHAKTRLAWIGEARAILDAPQVAAPRLADRVWLPSAVAGLAVLAFAATVLWQQRRPVSDELTGGTSF